MGHPSLQTVRNVTVHIVDVSLDSPSFSQSVYNASIDENNPIGAYITTVAAVDRDPARNARISYRLDIDAQGSIQFS